jgi:hypothetical protein
MARRDIVRLQLTLLAILTALVLARTFGTASQTDEPRPADSPGHPEISQPPVTREPPAAAVPSTPDDSVLVASNRLGNNARINTSIELHETSALHIYAIGEIMVSDRFDYGWIVDEQSGDAVWEMTRQNTHHAGGALKNRRYDGIITLPPGRYTVHYVTDDSHAYGSFNQDPPDDPEGWGITVTRAEHPASPRPPE